MLSPQGMGQVPKAGAIIVSQPCFLPNYRALGMVMVEAGRSDDAYDTIYRKAQEALREAAPQGATHLFNFRLETKGYRPLAFADAFQQISLHG